MIKSSKLIEVKLEILEIYLKYFLYYHDYESMGGASVRHQSFIHDTQNHRVSCIDIRVFRYTKIHKDYCILICRYTKIHKEMDF